MSGVNVSRSFVLAGRGWCRKCQAPLVGEAPSSSFTRTHIAVVNLRRDFASTSRSRQDSKVSESKEAQSRARTAYEQRQILDQLRTGRAQGTGSKQSSSITGQPGMTQADDLRAAAEAALRGGQSGVGPMSLGMMGDTAGRMPRRPSRFDQWSGEGKPWKELRAGQKVARSTIFSSRVIFITGGAALTLILAYALATELLAKNSPTVVYGEACKLVSNSPEVKEHLLPPFAFHTSLSAVTSDGTLPAVRGRRNRNVSAAVVPDGKTGEEILLLRFFVGARDKDKDLTIWQRTRQGVVDGYVWTKDQALDRWDDLVEWWEGDDEHASRRRELSFDGNGLQNQPASKAEEERGQGFISGSLSSLLGSFVGLTRGAGAAVQQMAKSHEPGTWSSGEVHGELRKDENGVFQWKRLFMDVPSSASMVRTRVWIIKDSNQVKR